MLKLPFILLVCWNLTAFPFLWNQRNPSLISEGKLNNKTPFDNSAYYTDILVIFNYKVFTTPLSRNPRGNFITKETKPNIEKRPESLKVLIYQTWANSYCYISKWPVFPKKVAEKTTVDYKTWSDKVSGKTHASQKP